MRRSVRFFAVIAKLLGVLAVLVLVWWCGYRIGGFFSDKPGQVWSIEGKPLLADSTGGTEEQMRQRFRSRLQTRFPLGSQESELIRELWNEGFKPSGTWTVDRRSATIVAQNVVCTGGWSVDWSANAVGVLTAVDGSFGSSCL
ncbi:hypothetical protein [Methylovirgula sp. 4M-Z18]|uniref:hypothetical protein n=1 Tax=Methylovirgula sp. 4M-Z18 TaxID=2293567 RepID=UPI0011C042B2|nr:hypothetical protein [Methylovirgula sp. 4M-Z18]